MIALPANPNPTSWRGVAFLSSPAHELDNCRSWYMYATLSQPYLEARAVHQPLIQVDVVVVNLCITNTHAQTRKRLDCRMRMQL